VRFGALMEEQAMSETKKQREKMKTQDGFIAALDQSGGSTPKALELYGIPKVTWKDEAEMFDLVHAMRARIIESPVFGGDRILAAILFEATMDRQVDGQPTADYLWQRKNIVPFLKIDQGLATEANGVQLMKPIPDLDALLERAKAKNIFGTKMRSVIKQASPSGIASVVDQQLELAERILGFGLVPIIEPEVDIHCPDKEGAEKLLESELTRALGTLTSGKEVMLKLTIPSVDNYYAQLIAHPLVLRVVALSGGYSRQEANERLSRQKGMIASFSRALSEGLSAAQSAAEFDAALDASIQSIYDASKAG
jgi:fructose-bisphosphate aldolase, class I